jgi:gluconolactonase
MIRATRLASKILALFALPVFSCDSQQGTASADDPPTLEQTVSNAGDAVSPDEGGGNGMSPASSGSSTSVRDAPEESGGDPGDTGDATQSSSGDDQVGPDDEIGTGDVDSGQSAASRTNDSDEGVLTDAASVSEEMSTAELEVDAGTLPPDQVDPIESSDAGGSPQMASSNPNVCPPGPFDEDPIPEQAQVEPQQGGAMQPGALQGDTQAEVLCTGMDWVEGPVWVGAEEALYFSNFRDMEASSNSNGSIMRWQEGEGCSEFVANAGTNGLALGVDGNLVGCRHLDRTITAFDIETGAARILADNYDGSLFSGPNDVAVRGDGNIYFTDPTWNLGNREQELPQSVYRIDPEGNVSVVGIFDGEQPNGVALSPDGGRLYIATLRTIYVHDVADDGTPGDPAEFVASGADGLAMDCAGNLYTSGGRVFSPDGEELGSFPRATNSAFGGPEGRTLFIVSNGQLSRLELNIPGLPN